MLNSRPETGIVRDPRYLNHRTLEGHPENHGRLTALYGMLDNSDLTSNCTCVKPRHATAQEILAVHSQAYFEKILSTAGREFTQLTPDTHTSADSYETALLAVGGIFTAIDQVWAGELANAFVLARPPGHHAERSRAMGFCLFNTVALGAAYARTLPGCSRVLIVDWDVHHGNGIQHIFESDPSILYFSTHQYPLFPGTGHFMEQGKGNGEGYTMNIPLKKGMGDAEFLSIYHYMLNPVARDFKPDLILVAAGFDIHRADPLGRMKVSTRGFAAITRVLMEIARNVCGSKLVLSLEGGYQAEALCRSVSAVISELSDNTCMDYHLLMKKTRRRKFGPLARRCQLVHGKYWDNLRGRILHSY